MRLETMTWGGVRSTTIMAALELMTFPFVMSCAVTE
jgi:hypothetical protein